MGAWGPGNFDNDAVRDWFADLRDWPSVGSALTDVLHAPPVAYVSADACSIALGAAEIVAACLGRPGRVPEKPLEWANAHRAECDEETRRLAEACARKIETDSELQKLFDEGGTYDEWHSEVRDLIQRLAG
jgi:hypothetical protein